MSEHTEVTGECNYTHIPYREKGFSYCKHCKKFCNKLEIQFNEGWFSDWMQVNCGKCHKAIWVCEFKNELTKEEKNRKYKGKKEEDCSKEGLRIFVKDNKKCEICGKPTNHYDCAATTYCGLYKKSKECLICSNKCNKEMDKKIDKLREENKEINKEIKYKEFKNE